jgi:hypothetical protein
MILRWIKKLFVSRSPSPGRIIYSLPSSAVFSKYYDRDIPFKDVDWTNWSAVVDGFYKRFDAWYFQNMVGGHSSYVDLCCLCALVEVFAHYTNEKDWHDPGNYKEFLRRADSIFRKRLAKPVVVTRFEGNRWNQGALRDYADVFYAGVRCSLHHHGDLASYAGMSGTNQIAREFANAGQSTCGKYTYSLIVFDPGKIKEMLRLWLKRYCDDLKTNPTSKAAGIFRQTFQRDFGITIT